MNSVPWCKVRLLLPALMVWLYPISSVEAQLLDSSAGLGAGLVQLFGETKAFSAKAQVQVFTTNRQETLRGPMNFALLDGRVRMDFDLNAMRGSAVPAAAVKLFSQAGLNQIASIVRLDKRVIHNVFSRARSYVDVEISAAEAQAAQGNVQVQRTPLGKETLDKHPCTRNKVVVKNAKGAVLLDATTWNAEDMKDFPLQIMVQTREGTTLVRFSQVQMTRPAASLFDPPAGFIRHDDQDSLIVAAMRKNIPPITKTDTSPAVAPAVSNKTASLPDPATPAKKAAPASGKSGTGNARPAAPRTNTPAAKTTAPAKR